MSFEQNQPFSVPKQVGDFYLELLGLNPNTPETKARIKWEIRRNPKDVLTGSNPSLNVDQADPTKATMGTDAQGSFNVIAYCDPTGAGGYQNGKILAVFNIVMVLATVRNNTNSIISTSSNFSVIPTGGGYLFDTGPGTNYAIRFGAGTFEVLLEGGGEDAKLGVFSAARGVFPGWLGNVTSISAKARYQNGKYAYKTIVPSPPTPPPTPPPSPTGGLPLLDTQRAGQGGELSYRKTSNYDFVTPMPSRGYLYTVTAKDSPGLEFQVGFHTDVDKLITQVSGGMHFVDYFCAFGQDYYQSFSVIGKVVWSFEYKYLYNFQNSTWVNTGSTVTSPTELTVSGFPISAAAAGAVTLGPPKCPDAIGTIWDP